MYIRADTGHFDIGIGFSFYMSMLFFELLQLSVGNRGELSCAPSDKDWVELFALSQKQAMTGIAFLGIEKLPAGQKPPKEVLIKWYMATEHIKAENRGLDNKALMVAKRFLKDGFPSVILKGQGIAKLYPKGEYRTPGDIDIWLGGRRRDIVGYVRRYSPNSLLTYHHVEFDAVKGTEVEVHFTPSWMNSYFTNRRLQRFFDMERSKFCVRSASSDYQEIPMPSLAFNRVFILVHIYRHFFFEGIGLRQLMDYYYVLCQGFSDEERKETVKMLKSLGMIRFAGAVMYVLQTVFAMDDNYLLVDADEKEGRFLLEEIMLSGNFGQYDERVDYSSHTNPMQRFWHRVWRSSRFIFRYPSEAIWNPIFKIVHFFYWRRPWSL